MPVGRIERLVNGKHVAHVERHSDGTFHCFRKGMNMEPVRFGSLDEVADFLRTNPEAGVRMNPRWSKISRHIFIDGVPR